MSDVHVSLDSSDIRVIVEALTFKQAALKRTASKKREAEQHPLAVQIERLINVFSRVNPNPHDPS